MSKPTALVSSSGTLPFSLFGVANEPDHGGIDLVARIRGGSGKLTVGVAPTDSLLKAIAHSQEVVLVLSRAVGALKRREVYSGSFVAYLQGQIDEEEFNRLSEQCAYEPKSVEPQQLAHYARILIDYTDADFTPSEVGDLFEADSSSVGQAVQLLLELQDQEAEHR